MSKGPYESVDIKDIDFGYLIEEFDHPELAVAYDAAKHTHYACIMAPDRHTYYLIRFDAHQDMEHLEGLLDSLPADEITHVIEPTGSYSAPLKSTLQARGDDVRKMKPDKCGQADKLFDGVPSLHDGKSAYLIAQLYYLDLSQKWAERSEAAKRMRALHARIEPAEDRLNRLTGRMEGLVARFWPELTGYLDLTTASLQALLAEYGSPQQVAKNPGEARELLEDVSRQMLADDKIDAIVDSAAETTGEEPIEERVEHIKDMAGQMRQVSQKLSRLESRLEDEVDESGDETAVGRICEFGGPKLATAIAGQMGLPDEYEYAGQFEKAAGLNLKEKSSGETDGEHSITKRGPGQVRKYLYLLACRMVGEEGCPYVDAWYRNRLEANGGHGLKALVAVMRKLLAAIFHIGRGAAYRPAKLFDLQPHEVVPAAE